MTNGPDYGKLKMARLLVELDASHAYTVPADILADAKQTIAWQASAAKTAEWQRNRRAEDAAKRQAILDADVEMSRKDVQCEARVSERGRMSFYDHRCNKPARYVRTWINGAKVPTQAMLCGTHRQIKGEFGWPY